jgi:ATP-binding cassette subfamily C (CFTR/MRP) protein 1
MRYVLNIPNHLTIHPGEKYIIMGESDGGKSSLLHAIMGNLTKIAGGIKYGGKVGYMPQKLWFQRLSVRQNILFGLPEDPRKLRNIYRLTMLQN